MRQLKKVKKHKSVLFKKAPEDTFSGVFLFSKLIGLVLLICVVAVIFADNIYIYYTCLVFTHLIMTFYKKFLFKALNLFILGSFIFIEIGSLSLHSAFAQSILNLPEAGTMISTTSQFKPAVIKGLSVFPNDPFAFDFIIHPGDKALQGDALTHESKKLIKYFMAALTTPETEMWVNLSPDEPDRIIEPGFDQTEMGRDLLAQDYLLKQMTSSLLSPESDIGKEFWDQTYVRIYEEFGNVNIPADILSKVWIVPETAEIFENGNNVFITKCNLKVLLEEEFLQRGSVDVRSKSYEGQSQKLSLQIIRQIVIPELEREVNFGKFFAPLRQIAHSVILASWYKKNVQGSILEQLYIDQHKTEGVAVADKKIIQKIYSKYVQAFKSGMSQFIREDYDPVRQMVLERKYFTGGAILDFAMLIENSSDELDFKKLHSDLSKTMKVKMRMGNDSVVRDNLTIPSSESVSWGQKIKDALKKSKIVLTDQALKSAFDWIRYKQVDYKTSFFRTNEFSHVVDVQWEREYGQIDKIFTQRREDILKLPLATSPIDSYLDKMNNPSFARNSVLTVIDKMKSDPLRKTFLEIGSGDTSNSVEIMQHFNKLPEGEQPLYLATDIFPEASSDMPEEYVRQTQQFKNKNLVAQKIESSNMAVARAQADILSYLPDHSLDYILLFNPENQEIVASLVLLIRKYKLARKLKENGRVIIYAGNMIEYDLRHMSGYLTGDESFPINRFNAHSLFGSKLHKSKWEYKGNIYVLKKYFSGLGEKEDNLFPGPSLAKDFGQLRSGQDAAMIGVNEKDLGGIDMNPEFIRVKSSGSGVKIQFPAINLNVSTGDINGFEPIIINITPLTNIPQLLVLKKDVEINKLSGV